MYELDHSARYLETLDNWRESHETAEELKYSLAIKDKIVAKQAETISTVMNRMDVIISVLQQHKNNPSMMNECAVHLDQLREICALTQNDIETKN
jgi:hypothetical protein